MDRSKIFLLMAIIAMTGCAWPVVASGQEPLGEDDPTIALLDGKVTQFLEQVSLNEMESAYAELLSGSDLARQSDEIEKLIQSTREIETKYGKYRSFERIASRRIGSDLITLKYLYKCENFPVIWRLTYYRDFKRGDAATTNNNWVVISVRFDTRIDTLE
ncbi:MAG: hypothetical protein KDA42_14330 [Planctomycetales bacterium]|nr:hypothetical protein [Planctomycetales bacterium]